MKYPVVLFALFFHYYALAVVFRTPIYPPDLIVPTEREIQDKHLRRRSLRAQQPLYVENEVDDSQSTDGAPGVPRDPFSNPILGILNLAHYTGITLGNPPQPFRALIDISWPDLFVTSSECAKNTPREYPGLCAGHFNYHAAWSRTHVGSSRQYVGGNRAVIFQATVSTDTLTIAGVELKNQQFAEALRVGGMFFPSWLESADAILGLAPDSGMSQAGVASPFTNMIDQNLLDESIISIMLGRWGVGAGTNPGELMFGGIDPEMMAPNTTMKFVPLSDHVDPPDSSYMWFNSTWHVDVRSVSFKWENRTSHKNVSVHVDTPGYGARLDSLEPVIIVPNGIAEALREIAQPKNRPFLPFKTVSCDMRHVLPPLVFDLGGQEIEITARHYLLEFGDEHGLCIYNILGVPEWVEERNVVVLGTPFMRGYYIVLDKGRRNIGFGTPWFEHDPDY